MAIFASKQETNRGVEERKRKITMVKNEGEKGKVTAESERKLFARIYMS